MIPLVSFCCFGCSLRFGTVGIAMLSLLGSVYAMYVDFKLAHDIKKSHNKTLNDYIGFAYVGGILSVINIIMNLVLVAAADARKRGPIMCWLIWEIFAMVVSGAFVIFISAFFGFAVLRLGVIICWVIHIYFLIVVYSFAQSLLEEQQQNRDPRPTNPFAMSNFNEGAPTPYKQLDNVV